MLQFKDTIASTAAKTGNHVSLAQSDA